jgi:pimeloyl-ACP methyl ester carboxylesterase
MAYERLVLDDGRAIEYLAVGDSAADLLFLLPGTPCAAVEFPHVISAAVQRALRVAVYSRPGYVGSTRDEGRTVLRAGADTAALADHLGAAEFFVAGWSAGGPFALACAAALPHRVRACAVIAGFAPVVEAGDAARDWYSPEEWAERKELSRLPATELTARYEAAAQPIKTLSPADLERWPESIPKSDIDALRTSGVGEALAAAMRRGVSDGVSGWMDDNAACRGDWGFSVSSVTTAPVVIRHGDRDPIVSMRQAEWLAEHMPTAIFERVHDGGHTSVTVPFEPVLDSLFAVA